MIKRVYINLSCNKIICPKRRVRHLWFIYLSNIYTLVCFCLYTFLFLAESRNSGEELRNMWITFLPRAKLQRRKVACWGRRVKAKCFFMEKGIRIKKNCIFANHIFWRFLK